ncbi:hypothetical protein [Klebsiella pneumoniae]|uniref:Colicin V n=1 Tax=Klebsiella pneumoniae TaxID=573 RepID=A0A5C2LH80_KLEPN|nr:hypothetical protein [Klebsiella pneumoniae]QEP91692.1 hypothetical protein FZ929_14295 [Klebsiella pneumoniae]
MRELNVFEMQEISGGYSWDTSSFMSTLTSPVTNGVEAVGSAIAFGTVAAMWGAFAAGGKAGDGGGILGFGIIAELGGVIFGAIGGFIGGAVSGIALGWEQTVKYIADSYTSALDGTFTPWA